MPPSPCHICHPYATIPRELQRTETETLSLLEVTVPHSLRVFMKALALGLVLSLWLLLVNPAAAFAHAVQTDYFVDLFASQLELQFTATFSTGEPMAEATVLVYAPEERETPWQESQTDELGHFTFVPDESLVGDWRIEFKQDGHEDIRIVPVDAQGIDYHNISHGGNRDFHLMAHLREGLSLFSAAGMGAAAIVFQRRWFRAH